MHDDRKWLPTDWMDEAIPEPQETREDFLRPADEPGTFWLCPDEDEPDEFCDSKKLRVDDTVQFDWTRQYGIFTASFVDGQWVTDRPYPASANNFCRVGDEWEGVCESLQAAADLEGDAEPFSVHIYEWQHGGLWMLQVQDGKPVFVEVKSNG